MYCPRCGHPDTKVYDTRLTNGGRSTRRRRECLNCQQRFTTLEEVKFSEIKVEKRNGQIIDFSEKKLEQGVRKAFNKRHVEPLKIKKIVQAVVDDILATGKNPIKSTKIGRLVLKHLGKVDEAACICYASMFLNFDSLEDFNRIMNDLSRD